MKRKFSPSELPFLIETAFSSTDEGRMIRCLCGDDAQTFIDVIDEARYLLARHLEIGSTVIDNDTPR